MDLQEVETVTDRLAAEFGIRPPKVTSGWVPRSMRLGVRAKLWKRRLGLVIGPAAERLEPDELEGELAVGIAGFTLRWGFIARLILGIGAALICESIVLALLADAPGRSQDLTLYAGTALWIGVFIWAYRDFVYRADRKVVEVLGAGPVLAVLEAERQRPSNGWVYLWALPHADRRAGRIAALRLADETAEDHRGLPDRLSHG